MHTVQEFEKWNLAHCYINLSLSLISIQREIVDPLFCRQGTEMAVVQNKLGDTEGQLENFKR